MNKPVSLALLVGGVGIANAVATYIDRRRKVIAAFKSLGATSRVVFGLHLLQVLLMAGLGVVLGVALGSLIPVALTAWFGDALPIRADLTLLEGRQVDAINAPRQ